MISVGTIPSEPSSAERPARTSLGTLPLRHGSADEPEERHREQDRRKQQDETDDVSRAPERQYGSDARVADARERQPSEGDGEPAAGEDDP